MFGPERRQVLESSRWNATGSHGNLAGYLEAWDIDHDGHDRKRAEETSLVKRNEFASDDEIESWLYQTGEHLQRRATQTQGGIRVLLCERRHWSPRSMHFSMKKSSFLSTEASFDLPPESLALIRLNDGQYHYKFKSLGTAECSISIVIKLPQMYQLGNHGMTLSHSFKTGVTSAFIHGWNLLRNEHEVTGESIVPVIERVDTLLAASELTSLNNPLLLPTILLKDHTVRIQEFLEQELVKRIEQIEFKLRVTKSARLAVNMREHVLLPDEYEELQERRRQDLKELKELMANEQLRTNLTTDLNTTLTDCLNFMHVLKWDQRYCQFLVDVQKRIHQVRPDDRRAPGSSEELDSMIRYLDCYIQSHIEYLEALIARLNLQLSVLYNLAAQVETDLTSRMTRATVLDSSAMKTLALVTAIFLPPTFVATLFSMTMFNWQASTSSDDGDGPVVVPQFWIYWAISIPVTVLILLAWRIWWHFQKAEYERRFQKSGDAMDPKPSWKSYLQRLREPEGWKQE